MSKTPITTELEKRISDIEGFVNGSFENLSGTSINNSPALIPFTTTLNDDTNGAFSNDTFTAPVAGRYAFAVNLFSVSTLSNTGAWYLRARKNGTTIYAQCSKAGTGAPNTTNSVQVSGIVDLEAGETLVFDSFTDIVTTINLTVSQGFNTCHIWQVT